MRFHVLAVPHTVSLPEYSTCAFTQKVVKLCRMLKMQGHYVIHYGHEDSKVACDEHVTVVRKIDLEKSYPGHDWRTQGWPKYDELNDWAYKMFYAKTIAELLCRKEPGDFLLLPFGNGQRIVSEVNKDMLVVETGIGYPDGGFAPYRIFESNTILSAYHGQSSIKTSINNFWYDAVIPNAYDPEDFTYRVEKGDYFLFLGRQTSAKGAHIAEQIAKETGIKLIAAGAGDHKFKDHVASVGVVGPQARAQLLATAKAVLCPSTFMEPFCGVQIEAMLSGTPVISSDWGAFTEYNKHGLTGYRCKTFEQFVWATKNIDSIAPDVCRAHGEQFTLEKIAPLYDEYFRSVAATVKKRGWYETREDRENLKNVTFQNV